MTFTFTSVRNDYSALKARRMIAVDFGRSWMQWDSRMEFTDGRFGFRVGEMDGRCSIKYRRREPSRVVRTHRSTRRWEGRSDDGNREHETLPSESRRGSSKTRRQSPQTC